MIPRSASILTAARIRSFFRLRSSFFPGIMNRIHEPISSVSVCAPHNSPNAGCFGYSPHLAIIPLAANCSQKRRLTAWSSTVHFAFSVSFPRMLSSYFSFFSGLSFMFFSLFSSLALSIPCPHRYFHWLSLAGCPRLSTIRTAATGTSRLSRAAQ